MMKFLEYWLVFCLGALVAITAILMGAGYEFIDVFMQITIWGIIIGGVARFVMGRKQKNRLK